MSARVLLLLPLLLAPIPGEAQVLPADTLFLDLAGAIEHSLEVSPEVGIQDAQREFAEARLDQARASRFLTEFTATTAHAAAPGLAGITPETDTDALYLDPTIQNDWENLRPYNHFEVEALQPVYTWGQLSGSRRAAWYGVEVEIQEMRGTELEVAMRTGEIYYNVLLTDALGRLAGEAEESLGQVQAEVNRLLDEGDPMVTEADLFQLELAEQEVLRQVTEVEQQGAVARSAFRRQLFLPEGTMALPHTDVLEPLPLPVEDLNTFIELGLTNRPELRQAEAGRGAREALVEVARSDYFPKLFFGFSGHVAFAEGRYRQPSPYVGDPFRGRSLRVGVGVQQQLNFLQTRSRVDQARAELNEVRYQAEAADQLIAFEVEEAFRAVQRRYAAMESRRESVRISGEWLRTEQINLDLDIGDPANLVGAVQTNLELQAAHLEAIHAYNVAVLRLLRVTGLLNAPEKVGTLVDL